MIVAAGDGVHSGRLFAAGRDDIAGILLVDPVPVGFGSRFDRLLPDFGHPSWLGLDPARAALLGDFGDIPLVVIGQDPNAVFLSRRFVSSAGRSAAAEVSRAWQEGLDFYVRLSGNSRSVVADGTGMDAVLSVAPDLIVKEVLELANGAR